MRKGTVGIGTKAGEWALVSRIHLNLGNTYKVTAAFGSGVTSSDTVSGMRWIGPGGLPPDIRTD